ncbi:MAG: winged helix-turn-helix transcriptional regulator [Actinomycetota bacterium]|nr:winged helix-turn-helix transcriptional regulator [Actinomycetota bacterium]
MHPGGSGLSLLSAPLNVHILKALKDEERSLTELSRAVGLPPASTLRSYLRSLVEIEALARHTEGGFPGGVSYALTPAGEDLLKVGDVLQRWLEEAPDGPISLGSTASKSATKALVDGWSALIVRALAARPLTLTELHRLVPQISYPTLERKLTAMRLVHLLQAEPNGSARGTPYGVTPWLRKAVPTLGAGIAWERRHLAERAPQLGRLDIEAGFLLAVPLVELPPEIDGVCRLSIEVRKDGELDYAGVRVALKDGKPASCVTRLEGDADAWATGSAHDWFRWINGNDDEQQLEFGGYGSLAQTLTEGLREALVPLAVKGR